MEDDRPWTSVFLAPVVAALAGSLVSGIVSGAAAIFTFSQSEQIARMHDQQIVEARLSVVETELREERELKRDVIALREEIARVSTKLDDMRQGRGQN